MPAHKYRARPLPSKSSNTTELISLLIVGNMVNNTTWEEKTSKDTGADYLFFLLSLFIPSFLPPKTVPRVNTAARAKTT